MFKTAFLSSFLDDAACKNIMVQVISSGDLTVEFCRSQEKDQDKMLCEMELTLPPYVGDVDVSAVFSISKAV